KRRGIIQEASDDHFIPVLAPPLEFEQSRRVSYGVAVIRAPVQEWRTFRTCILVDDDGIEGSFYILLCVGKQYFCRGKNRLHTPFGPESVRQHILRHHMDG